MRPVPVAPTPQLPGQHGSAIGLVVDVTHQCIFDRHSSFRGLGILERRIEQVVDLPALVGGNELVTKFVVGGVQRHGEGDRQAFPGERPNARHQSDRRDRQGPGAHPDTSWGGGGEGSHCVQHRFVVGHRFAHAHEDDVVHPLTCTPHSPGRDETVGCKHLGDDLGGQHVALDTALARRTERAGHAAPGLGGDAQRGACRRVPSGRVVHEHRFDQRPTDETPQGLDGRTAIGALLGDLGDHGREPGLGDPSPGILGEVRPLGGVDLPSFEDVGVDLLGTESRQAKVLDGLDPLVVGEVDPVLARHPTCWRPDDDRPLFSWFGQGCLGQGEAEPRRGGACIVGHGTILVIDTGRGNRTRTSAASHR